jgi:hypothetical protein
MVHPFPGLPDLAQVRVNTAITLPVGVEAYGAYALRAWLATDRMMSDRTRRFRIEIIGPQAAQLFPPQRRIVGQREHHTVTDRLSPEDLQDPQPFGLAGNPRQLRHPRHALGGIGMVRLVVWPPRSRMWRWIWLVLTRVTSSMSRRVTRLRSRWGVAGLVQRAGKSAASARIRQKSLRWRVGPRGLIHQVFLAHGSM